MINKQDFGTFVLELNTLKKEFNGETWAETSGIEYDIIGTIGENAKLHITFAMLNIDEEEHRQILEDEEGGIIHVAVVRMSADTLPEILSRAEEAAFQIACSTFRLGWEAHRAFKGERDGD